MEIGKQIKKYRTELSLSQDELADKIFVSRQSISNWENEKNYPDINSLLMMSNVFGVSLDSLVKGDIKEMQEKIKEEDIRKFKKSNVIFAIILLVILLLPVPMIKFFGWYGFAVYVAVVIVGFVCSYKIKKEKKKFNIQTFREIDAFMKGKRLDEIESQREIGKRPYQRVLLFIFATVFSASVTYLLAIVFKLNI